MAYFFNLLNGSSNLPNVKAESDDSGDDNDDDDDSLYDSKYDDADKLEAYEDKIRQTHYKFPHPFSSTLPLKCPNIIPMHIGQSLPFWKVCEWTECDQIHGAIEIKQIKDIKKNCSYLINTEDPLVRAFLTAYDIDTTSIAVKEMLAIWNYRCRHSGGRKTCFSGVATYDLSITHDEIFRCGRSDITKVVRRYLDYPHLDSKNATDEQIIKALHIFRTIIGIDESSKSIVQFDSLLMKLFFTSLQRNLMVESKVHELVSQTRELQLILDNMKRLCPGDGGFE